VTHFRGIDDRIWFNWDLGRSGGPIWGRIGSHPVTHVRGVDSMRNRQLGVTAIGWLFLLTPVAIVVYAGIRLAPVYLNYMKVAKAMDQVGGELKEGGANPQSIRTIIDRHFEIDMVDYPSTKDMKITKDGASWIVESQYDDEAPLFANLSLRVTFDKKVKIGGGSRID
jgi:hypothetical protein